MSHEHIQSSVPCENIFPEIFLLEPTLSPGDPAIASEIQPIQCCEENRHRTTTCTNPERAHVESSRADQHEIGCEEIQHDATASGAENDTSALILKENAKRPTHDQKRNTRERPPHSDVYVFVVCVVLCSIPAVCFGFELVVLGRVLYILLRVST